MQREKLFFLDHLKLSCLYSALLPIPIPECLLLQHKHCGLGTHQSLGFPRVPLGSQAL